MDKQTISLIMSGLALVIAVVVLVLHGMQHWFHSAGDHVIACVHKDGETWTEGDYTVTEDGKTLTIKHENEKVKFAQVFDESGNALPVTCASAATELKITLNPVYADLNADDSDVTDVDWKKAEPQPKPKHIVIFSD